MPLAVPREKGCQILRFRMEIPQAGENANGRVLIQVLVGSAMKRYVQTNHRLAKKFKRSNVPGMIHHSLAGARSFPPASAGWLNCPLPGRAATGG
jgi:hypothetical protein